MTFEDAVNNDIFAAGDVVALPGISWKERIEKPKTPYRHVGMLIDKEHYVESKPGGTTVSKLADLDEFVVIKTGIRFDSRISKFVDILIGSKTYRKYSRLHSILAIWQKNNPYKMFSAALVGTILINRDYHLVLRGLTPSRLVDVLTKLYGRKIVKVSK